MEEQNELLPDIYTLVDDEGNEQAFELLDEMELDDERYFALAPYFDDPAQLVEEECDLVILKAVTSEDGEELMATIDNEEEYEKVGNIFITKLMQDLEDDYEDEVTL